MIDLVNAMSNMNGLISQQRLLEGRIMSSRDEIIQAIRKSGLTVEQVSAMPEFQTSQGMYIVRCAFFSQEKPHMDEYNLGA